MVNVNAVTIAPEPSQKADQAEPRWPEYTLADLSAFITKGSTPTTYGHRWTQSGILFLRSECVSENGLDLDESMFISPLAHSSIRRSEVVDGDLLITITGNVGRIVRFRGQGVANINQHIARVRIVNQIADRSYVYHYLARPELRRHYSTITTGQAYPQISLQQVRETLVRLPPLKEQRTIAEALSDADALIESLESLIAKKRAIKQGAMQDLLSGRKRLPGFMGEWSERRIFELAQNKKELFDDGDWIEAEHLSEAGVRFIQTGNIGVGHFIEREEKKFVKPTSVASLHCKFIEPGDLLICRLADPAGRACVMPNIGEPKMVTSVDVTIFRPPNDEVDRSFLSYVFSTQDWLSLVADRSGGTTHKRIARGVLGKLVVRIPNIDEQRAIAQVLASMDAEIAVLDQKLKKARQIKQGMMQELLTGRVHLA